MPKSKTKKRSGTDANENRPKRSRQSQGGLVETPVNSASQGGGDVEARESPLQGTRPYVSFPSPPSLDYQPFDSVMVHNSPTQLSNPVNIDENFHSLGSTIPVKIKEKIWAGEFTDLALLLKSSRQLQEYSEEGQIGELQFRNGRLCVTKPRGSNFKMSIEQWTSAFIVFISIYLERFPNRSQELLKYLRDVRLAATRSDSWWKYDEQFRQVQSNNPSRSWGTIDLELWLLYVNGQSPRVPDFAGQTRSTAYNSKTTSQITGTPAVKFNKQRTSSPKSFSCNYFNSGSHCPFTPCRYSHVCRLCGGKHAQTVCHTGQ
jgi:hypothetical protein